MPGRIKVWHVSNSFHYAGTDRALETWACGLDPRRFRVSAYARIEAGSRLAALKRSLRSAALLGPDPLTWRARLKKEGCDILHIHRHGAHEPGWDAVIREARAQEVRVIVETNVFGAHDASGEGPGMEHHFFVSAMCLWRYAGWPAALSPDYDRKHSVLYNPLSRADFPAVITLKQRTAARKKLGIPEGAFVLGRLGRPDLNKWPAWFPAMFARLAKRRDHAHLLLMQAPPEAVAALEALGLRGRYTQVPASGDWGRVTLAYQAMDCLSHASRVGESFGYTLAEAQAFGLPVVVDSTPWADNAQIEVVDHGVTGLVAGRPAAYLQGLEALCDDPDLRSRLGLAGKQRAWARFDAKKLTREMEARYRALLAGRPQPEQAWVREFRPDYEDRLKRRVAASPLLDSLWGARSAVKLHWRSWASLGLKALRLKA